VIHLWERKKPLTLRHHLLVQYEIYHPIQQNSQVLNTPIGQMISPICMKNMKTQYMEFLRVMRKLTQVKLSNNMQDQWREGTVHQAAFQEFQLLTVN
jgi:hypothetical protein